MEPVKEETENETVKEEVTISSEDVKSMVNVLDLCSQRGTWRVNELKSIGEFYERLVNVLKKNVDTK